MGRHHWYKLDENKNVVPCGLEEVQLRDIDSRRVALDKIDNAIIVSTVFLCLDHGFGEMPPMLFETYVELDHPLMTQHQDGSVTYGWGLPEGLCEGVVRRYSTWDEAKAGHDAIFALAKQWYESKQKEG